MSQPTTHPKEILLVDDEPLVLNALKAVLRGEPVAVHTAAGAAEALAVIERLNGHLALIVCDQRMPGMTGVEFLKEAKNRCPDAGRFLLTGYADLEALAAAVNQGEIHRFFVKPWDSAALLAEVRQALRHYETVVENRRLQALTAEQNRQLSELNRTLEQRVAERTAQLRRMNAELKEAGERLERSFQEAIRLMSAMIETLNPKLGKYMRNVAARCRVVAAEMGLAKQEVDAVEMAALVHDIGLVGLAEQTWTRDEREMSPEELKDYSNHPLMASVCLENVEHLRGLAEMVLHHHEHYGGGGFPAGIQGEEIPLGARIIGPVSDYYRLTCSWPENMAQVKAKAAKLLGPSWRELEMNDRRSMIAQIKRRFLTDRTPSRYDPKVVECLLKSLAADEELDHFGRRSYQQWVHYRELSPGMVLMERLRTKDGRHVLAAETVLTDKLIHGIRRLGDGKVIDEHLPVYRP